MSTAREADIERQAVAFVAKELGVMSTKMGTATSTGWPDRLFFIPGGRPLMIEFKRPGGKVTTKQEYIHTCLRSRGYDVEVHDSVSEAFIAVQRRLKKK